MLRTPSCTRNLIVCHQKLRPRHTSASCVLYSDPGTQYRLECLIAKWDWQIYCAGLVIMGLKTYAEDSPVHLNFQYMAVYATALPSTREPCLILSSKYSISPRLSHCPMGLGNMLCWICHNATQDICWGFSGVPELRSYVSECYCVIMNQRTDVSYPDSATQYCLDWPYCLIRLANLECSSWHNETHNIGQGFWGLPARGQIRHLSIFWLWNEYVASGFQCTSNSQLTNNSKTFTASFSKLDSCHLAWNRPAGNLDCSLSINFISCC